MMPQLISGYNARTKHIDLTYCFIRERYHRGEITVLLVSSSEQMADVLTKALPGAAFGIAMEELRGCVGMYSARLSIVCNKQAFRAYVFEPKVGCMSRYIEGVNAHGL
jgi:hypothetical protein